MGIVYRAHDSRLQRSVAIKALPDHLAGDPDRLARFEREARTLASLNHPNVAGIYGVEESEGRRYLVLELVEGPTLADRLTRGPIPLDEALDIAAQVAAGVAAAHEAGIVHRDLKPGNVKISPQGRVKVLDFGLAKSNEAASSSSSGVPSESPTITNPVAHSPTIPGAIMGTAPYMSPEQARGRHVDKRSDIWSFGVVLYECLTGVSPFVGETVSDSIGAILHRDVDLSLLPPNTPRSIRALLRRCLARDRTKRLHDIADARLEIEDAIAGGAESFLDSKLESRPQRSRVLLALLGAGIPIAAGLAALGAWSLKPEAPDPPLRRLEILVDGLRRDESHAPVLSPDGARLVYSAGGSLWVRSLSELDGVQLAGTEGATHPFWSPDGTQVGFHAGSRLWRMPASGGAKSMICVAPRALEGAGGITWTPDDRVVFANAWGGPIWEAPVSGGDPTAMLTADPSVVQDFHYASALPDGSGVLTVMHRAAGTPDTIVLVRSGGYDVVLEHPGEELERPVYADGFILYGRVQITGTIWAVPFSLESHRVTGAPVLVAESAALPSASSDGSLVYTASTYVGIGRLAWVDRTGAVLETVGQPQAGLSWPTTSPNDQLAATIATESGSAQAWVHDLSRGTRRRIATDAASNGFIGWLSDDQLAFSAGKPLKTFAQSMVGADAPRMLFEDDAMAVSSDGRFAFIGRRVDHSLDIFLRDAQSSDPPRSILNSSAAELEPTLRTDNMWLAYVSDESGRDEVYVTPFPSLQGRWQVSTGGGTVPRWTASGDQLMYQTNRSDTADVMSVGVTTEPELRLSEPVRLFSGADSPINLEKGWSPSADGRRILGILDVTSGFEDKRIVFVEHWRRGFEKPARRGDR